MKSDYPDLPGLPPLFMQRLQNILSPENYEQYLHFLAATKTTCFRVNTLKISIAELIDRLHAQKIITHPISWCEEGYSVANDQRRMLTETTEFQTGLLYIQNPSSLFASLVLSPKPGEEVLDLAAAPGGKTLHLAALMKNEGRIAAVEAVKNRFFRLKNNIANAGANIVQAYHKDGALIGRLVPKRFDRVLLDAPCSSEGRFDLNNPESYLYWNEKKITEMTRKQKQLIYSAIQCVKPNGILVYCTCSFSPEENEAIVQYALDKFGQAIEILPITVPFPNFQTGLSSWKNDFFSPVMENAIRIIPDAMMSGFFICKMRINSF
ncbi:MAG: RsmB/NOP family class I SAM-dependent RNA methyltransferase [Gammaproteobacteria bacterium]|nr:RsmB/NOP family class I SAM-dependent RNA methyltransferase [Gammaproteobacteria bacterium]